MTDNLEWDRTGSSAGTTLVSTTVFRSGLVGCRALADASSEWGVFYQEFSSSNVTTDLYVRFYFRIATMSAENVDIFEMGATGFGDEEGSLILNSDGTLSWGDDDATILATTVGALSTNTWYRIEVNYDAADAVEVLIDGSSVISIGSHDGDGVGTMALGMCIDDGTAYCGGDGFVSSAEYFFDDIAINDTSGSAQTSWPGAGSIVHMQPDGSAGDNNDASSGDCGSVDEVTPDGATTIAVLNDNGDNIDCTAESSSAAGIDSYDTITLVQVGTREAASATASETWALRLKSASGGTTSGGTNTSHNDTTYATNGDPNVAPRNYTLISYTDPTTAVAWTPTGTNSLDNMQVGMNAVAATLADINLSTLWALVEYVDGVAPSPTVGKPRYLRMGTLLLLRGILIIR
jgi:hypothetical protein